MKELIKDVASRLFVFVVLLVAFTIVYTIFYVIGVSGVAHVTLFERINANS